MPSRIPSLWILSNSFLLYAPWTPVHGSLRYVRPVRDRMFPSGTLSQKTRLSSEAFPSFNPFSGQIIKECPGALTCPSRGCSAAFARHG